MKGQELDWGKCPECGEELLNVSDSEENLVMCTECGKTFPEPPLGPVKKKRKEKKGKELRLPFGKHKGRTLAAVLQEEPSYLCWFVETVEGCEDVKQAILALPGFREEQAEHYERKHRKEASGRKPAAGTVCQALGAEGPTRQGTGDLYERLFRSWN